MRDLTGGGDDVQGLGQSAGIGRLEARVGELGSGGQALLDDLLGRGALEHALASLVVGLVEACEQGLEVGVAMNGDAQHLVLHPAVEALDPAVGLGCIGLGPAVLDLELAAGGLEGVGGEAGATIGEPVSDTVSG